MAYTSRSECRSEIFGSLFETAVYAFSFRLGINRWRKFTLVDTVGALQIVPKSCFVFRIRLFFSIHFEPTKWVKA